MTSFVPFNSINDESARHVTIFCWSLKAHLQGLSDDNAIISTMLPNPADAYYITNYKRKPPVAILMRLRQIFFRLASEGQLEATTLKVLFQTTYRLNEALMISERVRISPIPSLYTTHTTRLLLFYLFWLPLALYGSLGSAAATLLVTVAVGYAMLGLDEISHILELPFRYMPLRQLSKVSMIESADAMVYRPPPLDGISHACDIPPNPSYWYRQH
jgi:predicted membrane chloride channel (bestrophin family)